MRVVLDTNILISALMTRGSPPDWIYEEWRHGRFDLVSTEQQIDELPEVCRSSDPGDDFLLALCEIAAADYLVTGDKNHLLALESHRATHIVSARKLVELLGR